MKKALFILVLLAALTRCATVQEAPAGVAEPEIAVATLEVPHMEATTLSEMTLIVRVMVTNHDDQPLTLSRLEIVSLGVGPYEISPGEQTFHREIAAGATEEFGVPAQARALTVQERLGGQEGLVQVRIVAVFESEAGGFRKVIVRPVDTTYSSSSR